MNDLMLHTGGQVLTYEDLKAVPTPPSTRTWTPIPHTELLDFVKQQLLGSRILIEQETLAVSQAANGNFADRFFALLQIKGENGDYALMVGLRNSHSREYPAGLCVGSRVLICSNLAFSAEIVIARKHTKGIRRDLPRLISDAVGRLGDLRQHQDRRIEAYRQTALPDPEFHDLAIRALDARVICASKLPHVLDHYRRPQHHEFEARTVWSGFNAFTSSLKTYDLQDLPRRTRALHGLCDLVCQLN